MNEKPVVVSMKILLTFAVAVAVVDTGLQQSIVSSFLTSKALSVWFAMKKRILFFRYFKNKINGGSYSSDRS